MLKVCLVLKNRMSIFTIFDVIIEPEVIKMFSYQNTFTIYSNGDVSFPVSGATHVRIGAVEFDIRSLKSKKMFDAVAEVIKQYLEV